MISFMVMKKWGKAEIKLPITALLSFFGIEALSITFIEAVKLQFFEKIFPKTGFSFHKKMS